MKTRQMHLIWPLKKSPKRFKQERVPEGALFWYTVKQIMTFVRRTIFAVVLGGLVSAGLFVGAPKVHAQDSAYQDIQRQGLIFAGICESRTSPCACRDSGNCTLDDVLQVFVNISTFILGISGSLVLLMFIYGGFIWITAGGNENRIKQGKDILVGTVIGLVIIFGSYAAITILLTVLKTGELPQGNEEGGAPTLEEAATLQGSSEAPSQEGQ